jgi:hypothetical protein
MSQDQMLPEGGKKLSSQNQTNNNGIPDIDASLSRASKVADKIRVVHGVNEGYYDLEGKTVGQVRKSLREVHNIPGDAAAMIGQNSVGDDFVLEGGMSLEFIKEAGDKGRKPWKKSRQWIARFIFQ